MVVGMVSNKLEMINYAITYSILGQKGQLFTSIQTVYKYDLVKLFTNNSIVCSLMFSFNVIDYK